jgi:hypothetical protein
MQKRGVTQGAWLWREGEVKGSPFALSGVAVDGAPMTVHDLAAGSEPEAGAFVLPNPVKAGEGLEDALAVLGRDADTVVLDRETP